MPVLVAQHAVVDNSNLCKRVWVDFQNSNDLLAPRVFERQRLRFHAELYQAQILMDRSDATFEKVVQPGILVEVKRVFSSPGKQKTHPVKMAD
jgi:hypothetical protein